jgi:hypothetical protein
MNKIHLPNVIDLEGFERSNTRFFFLTSFIIHHINIFIDNDILCCFLLAYVPSNGFHNAYKGQVATPLPGISQLDQSPKIHYVNSHAATKGPEKVCFKNVPQGKEIPSSKIDGEIYVIEYEIVCDNLKCHTQLGILLVEFL